MGPPAHFLLPIPAVLPVPLRRGRRPRRPARYTMAFSINRRGVGDAAPYKIPPIPAAPPHPLWGWFQGGGRGPLMVVWDGVFRGRGVRNPLPLNGVFAYFCRHGQKWVAPEGAKPSYSPPEKLPLTPKKIAKKVLAIWRKIGYNVSVYGKHVRLNLIKARHAPRGTPLRRT